MKVWIAAQKVVFVDPDGTRHPGRIALARPIKVAGHYGCEVDLGPLHRPKRPIFGEDSLQALLLAAQLAGQLLHGYLGRGGRVIYPGNGRRVDVTLAAVFGPLLRAPPRRAPQAT